MAIPTKHQIIFVNGPRGSGKDLVGRFITNEFPRARAMKFATPLKAACAAMYGVGHELWKLLEREGTQAAKLEKRDIFFGESWVDVLIAMSEEHMKPQHGKDVFGNLMVNALRELTSTNLTVITDCRFEMEVLPVIHAFGEENCHIFRLHREGHNFNGDSGGYVFPNYDAKFGSAVSLYDINNVHEKMMFRIQILQRVNKIMGVVKEYV